MPDSSKQRDIQSTLGLDAATGRRRPRWRWIAGGVFLVLAGAAIWGLIGGTAQKQPRYITAPAERGTLTVTVTATGTLQPTNEVEISSEMSGTVRQVLVDDNDLVKAGQVLAELDTGRLEGQVVRARATLAMATARVKEAEAALLEAQSKYDRYVTLASRKVISDQEFDAVRAAHAQAGAALESAHADVQVAEADLRLRETDLRSACICSPIDGVVLRRNVEPGQTVAASLQAPVLFVLAESLATMELRVDVDEADISMVAEGQSAQFTVDAWPDRMFPARITKVRFAPDATESVVTYKTYLAVDNASFLLRPGMTATARIVVRTVADALTVPNAALRFSPPRAVQAAPSGGLLQSLFPSPPRQAATPRPAEVGNRRQIWVLRDGAAVPLSVAIGLTDGQRTEIVEGELSAGDLVVVDTGNGQ